MSAWSAVRSSAAISRCLLAKQMFLYFPLFLLVMTLNTPVNESKRASAKIAVVWCFLSHGITYCKDEIG